MAGKEWEFARDRHASIHYDPMEEPLFILPSYLKQLQGTSIQTVWYKANAALNECREVRVVGASLPEADVAIRALLNPLRYRLARDEVEVTVCDPNRTAYERWTNFLGAKVTWVNRRAGQRTPSGGLLN